MKYPKRSQYKHAKSQYRVRNWPEYETGLRRRGDLIVWLSEDAIDSWREPVLRENLVRLATMEVSGSPPGCGIMSPGDGSTWLGD